MCALMTGRRDESPYLPSGAIRNAQVEVDEALALGPGEFWHLDGDNRWRMIVCVDGEIWVTQPLDVHDYVLMGGEMVLITQRGSVLVEALSNASVVITSSLRIDPYRGSLTVFS